MHHVPRTLIAIASLLALASVARAAPSLDEVKRALLEGKIDQTAALAEELTKAEPDLREAWEILAACRLVLAGAVPPEVQQRLAWKPPAPVAPKPGETWYVAATSLRLRARAQPTAEIVVGVPINTAASVSAVSGEWAEVSVRRPPAMVLRFGAAPVAPEEPATGWVPWRYLSPAALEKKGLVSQAAKLEKQGFPAEALTLLERATALDPADRPLLAEKARIAVTARQYEAAIRAVQAADPMAGAGMEDWGESAQAKAYLACRGNRDLMVELDGGLPAKRLEKGPANACVTLADPLGPCVPAEPFAGAPFGPQDACSPEYRGSQSERACQAEVDAQVRRHEREKEKALRAATAFGERLAFLRQAFPTHGSAVRFLFNLPPAADGKARRMFAYSLPYTSSSCQASFVSFGWDRLEISSSALELPPAGGPLTIWVEVARPVSAVVGLTLAESAEQARAAVLATKDRAPSEDPSRAGEAGTAPKLALPTPVCHCSEPAYRWE